MTTPKLRGFAHTKKHNPERLKAIAGNGGASVPKDKRSFARDRDLASSAGRIGGEASRGGGRAKA